MILLTLLKSAVVFAAAPVLIMGHRGSAGRRPEHTKSAYMFGAANGADFIEPDLVMTKDGVLIARHENDISETTDVGVKFPARKTTKTVDGQSITGFFTEDFTLKEIKTLRAKERLPFRDHSRDFQDEVMTFDEVIALASDLSKRLKRPVSLIPELKHPTYFKSIGLDPVKPFLKSLKGIESTAIVQSFELGALREIKSQTRARLLFLVDDLKTRPADFVASGDKRTYGDLLAAQGIAEIAKTAQFLGPAKDQLIKADGSSSGVIELAHAVGLKVAPYTFRDEAQFIVKPAHGDAQAEYRLYFKLGVDGVFTDFVDAAVKARNAYR